MFTVITHENSIKACMDVKYQYLGRCPPCPAIIVDPRHEHEQRFTEPA